MFKVFLALFPIFVLLAVPLTVSAVPLDTIGKIADDVGLPKYDNFTSFFIDVIKLTMGIVFLISVIFIIVSGYRMVTSAGNEEAVTKAKSTMTWAVAGMVIVSLAWIIGAAVYNLMQKT